MFRTMKAVQTRLHAVFLIRKTEEINRSGEFIPIMWSQQYMRIVLTQSVKVETLNRANLFLVASLRTEETFAVHEASRQTGQFLTFVHTLVIMLECELSLVYRLHTTTLLPLAPFILCNG